MNHNITEIAFIELRDARNILRCWPRSLNRKMKAIRPLNQGLANEATVHDAEAPMDVLGEEEEGK